MKLIYENQHRANKQTGVGKWLRPWTPSPFVACTAKAEAPVHHIISLMYATPSTLAAFTHKPNIWCPCSHLRSKAGPKLNERERERERESRVRGWEWGEPLKRTNRPSSENSHSTRVNRERRGKLFCVLEGSESPHRKRQSLYLSLYRVTTEETATDL